MATAALTVLAVVAALGLVVRFASEIGGDDGPPGCAIVGVVLAAVVAIALILRG